MENSDRLSFNGKELAVGDSVIHVMGRHLRNSIIENIDLSYGFTCRIKMQGIKTIISPNQIVKI